MRLIKTIILFLSLSVFINSTAQKLPFYVIVHGTCGGSWVFKEVDLLITVTGNTVYRPSLKGQVERVHLANPSLDLETHIKDVINMILFEELENIILVGHSYGGMVVTGVADRMPERIKKLIYLVAFVPEQNENVNAIFVNVPRDHIIKDGGIAPTWVEKNRPLPYDVPQPIKTFTDPIVLKNPKRLKILTHYIHTVEKGKDPKSDDFILHANLARDKALPACIFESDHNPQWSARQSFVELLKKIETI